MGKTYRKYGNQLCKSDSYHEDKNRGWRKKKLRSINHSLRNKNRGKDEFDFNNKPESPPFDSISDKKIINFTYMGGGKKSMNFNFPHLFETSAWSRTTLFHRFTYLSTQVSRSLRIARFHQRITTHSRIPADSWRTDGRLARRRHLHP